MELKIDYSNIPETIPAQKSTYRPPRHVYFGKRDPESGMMEEEPKYVHQDYPRMMYKLDGDRIIADIVDNDTDMTHKLNSGWAKNPSAFGYLTAPSFEETLEIKRANEEREKLAVASASANDLDTGAGQKKWRDMNAAERAAFQAAKQSQTPQAA